MSDPTAHGRLAPIVTSDLATPAIALAVGAHPDDIDFGCGGTLAKWAASGCEVHYLVCTDGSKGSWDPSLDRAALVARRENEQIRASEVIGGAGRVTFLGELDGELVCSGRLIGRVAHQIRLIRPDVVLGHDPWKRYRLHPDHRNAGFLVTDAIVAARDPHFFPEQSVSPHRPTALLLWEADEADHVEDISGYQEIKLRALLEHYSQHESTMGIGPGHDTASISAFAERLRIRQAEAGAPLGLTAAEAFKLLTDL